MKKTNRLLALALAAALVMTNALPAFADEGAERPAPQSGSEAVTSDLESAPAADNGQETAADSKTEEQKPEEGQLGELEQSKEPEQPGEEQPKEPEQPQEGQPEEQPEQPKEPEGGQQEQSHEPVLSDPIVNDGPGIGDEPVAAIVDEGDPVLPYTVIDEGLAEVKDADGLQAALDAGLNVWLADNVVVNHPGTVTSSGTGVINISGEGKNITIDGQDKFTISAAGNFPLDGEGKLMHHLLNITDGARGNAQSSDPDQRHSHKRSLRGQRLRRRCGAQQRHHCRRRRLRRMLQQQHGHPDPYRGEQRRR